MDDDESISMERVIAKSVIDVNAKYQQGELDEPNTQDIILYRAKLDGCLSMARAIANRLSLNAPKIIELIKKEHAKHTGRNN
jgi:hypothetical protein